MNRASIEVILRGPSRAALPAVRVAADAVGGFVVDATWFGNLLLTAHVDMLAGDLERLAGALREQGLTVVSVSPEIPPRPSPSDGRDLVSVVRGARPSRSPSPRRGPDEPDRFGLNLDPQDDLVCAVAVRCVHAEAEVERDVPAAPG